MHSRMMCGTQLKQYPLNSKLSLFSPVHDAETTPAWTRPPAVRRHMAEAKTAVALVRHRFSVEFAGNPLDLNVDRLE